MNPIAERGLDDDILQIGDAFALEALPPRRLNGSQQKVGFVGARKSSHSCFVDFVPLETDARIDCGSGRPPNPELSRFVLCTPNQYIASKTLRAFEEWSGGSYAEGEQLKLMADKEKVSNDAVMRSSRGKPALFGGVFQLQVRAPHPTPATRPAQTDTSRLCSRASADAASRGPLPGPQQADGDRRASRAALRPRGPGRTYEAHVVSLSAGLPDEEGRRAHPNGRHRHDPVHEEVLESVHARRQRCRNVNRRRSRCKSRR